MGYKKYKRRPKSKRASKAKRKDRIRKELTREFRQVKGKIKEKIAFSEFEVQSNLYQDLKKLDNSFTRGEVSASTDDGRRCRFDIVVFRSNGDAAVIIETKKLGKEMSDEQLDKYLDFGIPIVEIDNIENVKFVPHITACLLNGKVPDQRSDKFIHYPYGYKDDKETVNFYDMSIMEINDIFNEVSP